MLDRIASFLGSLWYQVEHVFILELEGFRRIFRLSDPRVHSESRRIRKVSNGQPIKPTKKFFILVLFPGPSLPRFTKNLIEAVTRSPFNLVAVTNSDLSAEMRQDLLGMCGLLVERINVGRDFGGYKDALSIVSRRFGDIERLVIANDSVFYFSDGLDKLIADLDGPHDFIGVSEVFDHHYHIASFLMSFSGRVLRSDAFTDFWKRFRPIGTRRWNIFKGEGALTARLMQTGFRPHVLYRAESLRPHLGATDDNARAALLALLPAKSRRRVLDKLRNENGVQIADAIIGEIMQRNQMHTAGFLFRKYFNLPVVKRDIFYREIYSFDEISSEFGNLDSALRGEILDDVRRRGSGADLNWFKKLLYRHSAI